MYPFIFIFLFYFKITETFLSEQKFRAYHCSSLTLLSLKNTIYYGWTILDSSNPIQTIYNSSNAYNYYNYSTYANYSTHIFYIKIIPIYFITYILYDLKYFFNKKNKRIDLFVHHIVSFIWGIINFKDNLGFISYVILNEGLTFAYFIINLKSQLIYRLIFTLFIRFPVWLTTTFNSYTRYHKTYSFRDLFNLFIVTFMILLDCVWFIQNFKKLKQLKQITQ